MSSFCKQCSIKVFKEDFGDMKGITKQEDWDNGMSVVVLCEECGPCCVDPEGNCIGGCDDPSHKREEDNV